MRVLLVLQYVRYMYSIIVAEISFLHIRKKYHSRVFPYLYLSPFLPLSPRAFSFSISASGHAIPQFPISSLFSTPTIFFRTEKKSPKKEEVEGEEGRRSVFVLGALHYHYESKGGRESGWGELMTKRAFLSSLLFF